MTDIVEELDTERNDVLLPNYYDQRKSSHDSVKTEQRSEMFKCHSSEEQNNEFLIEEDDTDFTHSDASINVDMLSHEIARLALLRAVDHLGMDVKLVKEIIGEPADVSSYMSGGGQNDFHNFCDNDNQPSCYEIDPSTTDLQDATDSWILRGSSRDIFSTPHPTTSSAAILAASKGVTENAIKGALLKLGLSPSECQTLLIETEKQRNVIRDVLTIEQADDTREANVKLSAAECKEFGIEASENEAPRDESVMGKQCVQELEYLLSLEAKQLAENALKHALRALGDTEVSCDIQESESLPKARKSGSKSLARSSLTETEEAVMHQKEAGENGKGLFESESMESRVTGSVVSIEARRIAVVAIETALDSFELDVDKMMVDGANEVSRQAGSNKASIINNEKIKADALKCSGHVLRTADSSTANRPSFSILHNNNDACRIEVNRIITDIIIGAAEKLGFDKEVIDKVKEIVSQKLVSNNAGRLKDAKVHFDGNAMSDRTPSRRSLTLLNRLPTPHSSSANFGNENAGEDGRTTEGESYEDKVPRKKLELTKSLESSGIQAARNGSMGKLSTDKMPLVTKSAEEVPKKVVHFENSVYFTDDLSQNTSHESVGSDESQTQRIRAAMKGRRPTPFFSRTEKRRLFEEISGESSGMEAFGEEDEEELSEQEQQSTCLESTLDGSEVPDDANEDPSCHLINASSKQLDSNLTGSLPEMERPLKSRHSIKVRKTFSSCMTGGGSLGLSRSRIGEIHGKEKVLENSPYEIHSQERQSLNEPKQKLSEDELQTRSKHILSRSSSHWTGSKSSMPGGRKRRSSNLSENNSIGRPSAIKIAQAMNSSTSVKSMTRIHDPAIVIVEESDDSVGSRSSHSLPHVRPSKSRLTCMIDPSVNSCNTDEFEKSESLNSGELIGPLDEFETEEVMRIDLPEEDDTAGVKDFGEKLCQSLSILEQGVGERGDDWKDDITATSYIKNEASEKGSVTGFRYSEFMQKSIADQEVEEDLKSFVVISESEMKDIKHVKEGVLAYNEDAAIKTGDVASKGCMFRSNVSVHDAGRADDKELVDEKLTIDHDKDRVKSKISDAVHIDQEGSVKGKVHAGSASCSSMRSSKHEFGQAVRNCSLPDTFKQINRQSGMSLPGRRLQSKVSIDAPNFDLPQEAEGKVKRRLSNQSKSSFLSSSSLMLKRVAENGDAVS